MTSNFLDRISERHIQMTAAGVGRFVKISVALIPYGIGWLLGRVWWSIVFIGASFAQGFADGAAPPRKQ